MKCLHCTVEIPESFFVEWGRTKESENGRFQCPHCRADHVRRTAGHLPNGEPLWNFRLWGHLTRMRKKPPPDKA